MTTDHANETDETTPPAAEQPEAAQAPTEGTPAPEADGEQSEDDGSPLAKVRREAAAHRTRAREAEQQRDAAIAQRDALAAVVLDSRLRGSGVTGEAFRAAGKTVEEFVSPRGELDETGLSRAVSEVRERFGIPRPGRSPHTGTGTERPPKGSWSDVLNS